MDPVFGVDFTPAPEREGRASAMPQQAFQTRAVGAFDAHAGVEQEAATVLPVFAIASASSGSRTPRRVSARSSRRRTLA